MTKTPAFTLLESIIALLVTTIVIAIVGMTLPSAQRASRRSLHSPLDFELFLAELEDHDHDFQLISVSDHSCELKDSHTKKTFTLHCKGRVYLTSSGGYMELLDDVQPVSMTCHKLDRRRVSISVTRSNGQVQAGIVKFKPKEGKSR